MPDLPLTGRCQCGAAAYSIHAAPGAVFVCISTSRKLPGVAVRDGARQFAMEPD